MIPNFKAHPWHGISAGEDAPNVVNTFIEIVPSDTIKYEVDKKVKRIGLAHKFIEHGTRDELLAEYGLRGESLVKTILEGR